MKSLRRWTRCRDFFVVISKKVWYNRGMSYYSYLVRCSDGSYYAGFTTDPEKRVRTHNAGKGAKYTRSRLPVVLVYYESFEDEHSARSREWHLKRLPHAQKAALDRGEIYAEEKTN